MAKDKLDADLAVVREYIARWCRDDAAVRDAMDDLAAGVALLRIELQRAQDNAEELALGTERLTRENRRLNDEALTMTRQFDSATQERDRALAEVERLTALVKVTGRGADDWHEEAMHLRGLLVDALIVLEGERLGDTVLAVAIRKRLEGNRRIVEGIVEP